MSAIEQGQVYGRLQVIARIPDGRWRCRCLKCRSECTIISAAALQRGRVMQCFDCETETRRKVRQTRTQSVPRVASVAPIRVRRDEHGWALRQEAA